MGTDWERLKEVFAEASALPSGERTHFIESHDLDSDARAQVLALLAADDRCDEFLEAPAVVDLSGSRLATGDRVGRYEIAGLLGEGAVGVVYRARDPDLERDVALKLLHAGELAAERLVSEGQAIAKLAHPNVVSVFDVGTSDGEVFIAMELVEGRSLSEWLDQPRPVREIIDCLVQAGRGLAAAHREGVTHADFKPDNLLVGDDGRMRVVDFGLASRSQSAISGSSPIAGTPAFMAPEIFAGEVATPASDQFSFFVALYVALFGEAPFGGRTTEAIAEAVQRGRRQPVPRHPRVPRRVLRAIERGLATDPEDRFESMEEAVAELSRALGTGRNLLVTAVAVVATAALTLALTRSEALDPCASIEPPPIWSTARRAAVDAAFATHGSAATSQAFTRIVDGYAGQLGALERETCRRAHDKLDPPPITDARGRCLEQRRVAIEAVVDAVASGDRETVRKAVSGVDQLGGVDMCSRAEQLAALVLPEDPTARAGALELERQLAHAEGLSAAGDFASALPIARRIADQAGGAARYLLPRATFEVGLMTRGVPGNKLLREAGELAAALGDDRTSARAWARLFVRLVDERANRGKLEELEELIPITGAVVRRSRDVSLRLRWLRDLGHYWASRGDFERSLELYRQSLEEAAAAGGSTSSDAGHAASAVGEALKSLGRDREALEHFQRGLELIEPHYGAGHPTLALSYARLGSMHQELGDHAEAVAQLERAVAIYTQTYGKQSAEYANAVMSLGRAKTDLGRHAEGIADVRAAIAAFTAAHGPRHSEVGVATVVLGDVLDTSGDAEAALAAYAEALGIYRETYGEGHFQVAVALFNTAAVERRLERLAPAIDHLREAKTIFVGSIGVDHYLVKLVAGTLGAALYADGQAAAALEPTELGWQCGECEAAARTEFGFVLAQLLWDRGGDRARALKVAREARALATRTWIAKIDAWLAERSKVP